MPKDAALESSSPKEVSKEELSPLDLVSTTLPELSSIQRASLTSVVSLQESRVRPLLFKDSVLSDIGAPNLLKKTEEKLPQSSNTIPLSTTLMVLMFKMSRTGCPKMELLRTTPKPLKRSTRTQLAS